MPLLFTCPHCETKTLVGVEFAGQAGACTSCGKPITVPEFHEDGTVEDIAPTETNSKSARLIAIVSVLIVVVGSVGYLIFKQGIAGVAQMHASSMLGACRQNTRKIADALNEYADDYGTYPPPVVTDANGKALYSWRVLILPYLGYQKVYDEFALNEPWDSETNMAVAYQRPTEYGCPITGSNAWTETNYMLITGPGTLFPQSGPLSRKSIIDSEAQTLLVVEMARPTGMVETYWTQPGDLDVSRMSPQICGTPGQDIGGNHENGATAATCDGRDHFLPKTLSQGEIRALITPRGEEPIPDDLLDRWD